MARIEPRCYPRSDRGFAERVARLVERLQAEADSSTSLAELLYGELQAEYPHLRVRVQDSLATLGPPVLVYVYRDGHPLDRATDGPGTMRRRDAREALFVRAAATVARSEALLAASRTTALEWISRAGPSTTDGSSSEGSPAAS